MSKFDSMMFSDDSTETDFVAHAKKYTKEEMLQELKKEHDSDNEGTYDKLTVDNVYERQVRYFVRVPDFCGFDNDCEGGCYTFCSKDSKGSFPVWVVDVR